MNQQQKKYLADRAFGLGQERKLVLEEKISMQKIALKSSIQRDLKPISPSGFMDIIKKQLEKDRFDLIMSDNRYSPAVSIEADEAFSNLKEMKEKYRNETSRIMEIKNNQFRRVDEAVKKFQDEVILGPGSGDLEKLIKALEAIR